MNQKNKLSRFFAKKSNVFLLLNLLFIAIIFFLSFNPEVFRPQIKKDDIAYYSNQKLTFSAWVCEEADVDYKSRRLTLCVEGKIRGRVLIKTDLYPHYDYGDILKVSGFLQLPGKIEDFDYGAYLARHNIYAVMYFAKIEYEGDRDLSWQEGIYGYLLEKKQTLATVINRHLPEPEAGLANAILFGYRRTVLEEDMAIFSRVGLSHLIAISGSHITILSAMIVNFFLFLGLTRQRSLILVFLFLFIYPLITGASASAVRSAIMGALVFLAIFFKRESSLLRALILSASLMLFLNPQLLFFDIGFQLSFAALIGIIFLYPIGEEKSGKLLFYFKLKGKTYRIFKLFLDTVNLTLVSQIVILPIALVNFKQLSLIAPLANILALWTFPPLLASLLMAIFLSLAFPALAICFFFPSYLLLKYLFLISNFLAAPPSAAFNISFFNWQMGGLYYLFLVIFIWYFRKRKNRFWKRFFSYFFEVLLFLTALLAPAFFVLGSFFSPSFRAGFLFAFTLFGLSMVLRQEVQRRNFNPSTTLVCKLIFCLFKVFILE